MSSSILWPVLNVEFTSDEFNAEMSIYCNWSDSLISLFFPVKKEPKKQQQKVIIIIDQTFWTSTSQRELISVF